MGRIPQNVKIIYLRFLPQKGRYMHMELWFGAFSL